MGNRSALMKAVLKGKVIAASDDIVEHGGYAYFPNEHVRLDGGPRMPARRPVLRRGARRQAPLPRRLALRGAASLDEACRRPLRLLGGHRGRLIASPR